MTLVEVRLYSVRKGGFLEAAAGGCSCKVPGGEGQGGGC